MQTYTVQQIIAMKSEFRDPPYPGFSLSEVLRRKKSCNSTLSRGQNAWKVQTIQSEQEGVTRVVQGALNKLAPERYSEVSDTLINSQLISNEKTMQIVIDLVFKKALQEPGYSELYARLCYDMAQFEYQQSASAMTPSPVPTTAAAVASAATQPQPPKPKSKFREFIIRAAEREFSATDSHALDDLSGEEREEAYSDLVKRKRANITFAGQLFNHKVLSAKTMFFIINTLLKTSTPESTPSDVDVEVLAALLETVGKVIDVNKEGQREKLDQHFERLRELQGMHAHPMRIRFKMMDLLDLRKNGWEQRVSRAGDQAPTTIQEQERRSQQRVLGPRSPTMQTPTSSGARRSNTSGGMAREGSGMGRFPSTGQFPDSPPMSTPPSKGWRSIKAPLRDAPTPTTPNLDVISCSGKDAPFEVRVKGMFSGFVLNSENEAIPQWQQKFSGCGYESMDELAAAVVSAVVREACTTTRKSAQSEASSFIRLGLQLDPDDRALVDGLTLALSNAIGEGIIEDVPKFNERFVSILHMVMGRETILELYCDAAKLLYNVYGDIASIDSIDPKEELLRVWSLLPRPAKGTEDSQCLSTSAVGFIVDLREEGLEELSAVLVASMVKTGLTPRETVQRWMASTSAAQAPLVVQHLQALLRSDGDP
jgi:hypothetical protein